MEDRAKGIRGTRVELILKNGTKIDEKVLVPKGDPEKPLTRDDIIEKLKVCAGEQADENILKKLVEEIAGTEGEHTFRNPMECARR